MSSEAAVRKRPLATSLSETEVLRYGREVLQTEAQALAELVDRLDANFFRAVQLLYQLRGNLMVTGMGKAGLIGQKLAATFASTGTRAHFLHPAEAFHGDLGRVQAGDVVLMLSQSGETGEVVQLLPSLQRLAVPLIAITATARSTVGQLADVAIALGSLGEACSLGLAPSTSTTAMLAMGDALALVVSRLQGFGAEDFARFHPGGSLGLKLSRVEEYMRPLDQCRLASDEATIRQMLATCTQPGRRTGATMLTDDRGRLAGLFTDSDLVRLIEHRNDTALDRPVRETMVTAPTTVRTGAKMSEAVELLATRKISELPVIDHDDCPVGMIDVTDVVGLLPKSAPMEEVLPTVGSPAVRIYPADEYAD